MLNPRKIINALIAVSIANIPTIFPQYNILLFVYILGLISLFVIIYTILNKYNH